MRNRLLAAEQVIVRTRAHASSLVSAVIALLLTPAVAGLLLAWIRQRPWLGAWAYWRTPAMFAVLAAAALIVLFYCARKYFGWLSTKYVLTSARLMVSSGLMVRSRQEIPLNAVRNIAVRQGVLARMGGYGTIKLVIGFDGPLRLTHVRSVHRFKGLLIEAVQNSPAALALSGQDQTAQDLSVQHRSALNQSTQGGQYGG